MSNLFPLVALFLGLLMLLPLYRVIKGPTLFDRIVAAGLMGTLGVLILLILGFMYKRPDLFVDLAIAYVLLNFIGTIAIGKYLERHRGETKQ
jgi:multicomponent Na+:H+ antiporter subunit F